LLAAVAASTVLAVPELPDISVYIEALEARIRGARLESIRLAHPFLLRTFDPPIAELNGQRVESLRRVGKRIALRFENGYWLVLHLMIAGRLHWFPAGGKKSARSVLGAFVFDTGTLTLTEAGTKRRASLFVFRDESQLAKHDPGGLEVLDAPFDAFRARLKAENHTLKRALTDPHAFSGIGNAYSDEILHRARLSPLALSSKLSRAEIARLHAATRAVLAEWTARLRAEAGGSFPEKLKAFRPEMAVHGRFGEPCPDCGSPVQRIVYAENECNYCARCQTGGTVLADRALSRLLHQSFPRSLDDD
jgi:formamidopyrimidine-DNA glycosylase